MAANDESAEESYRPFSDAELDDLRECYGFKDAYSRDELRQAIESAHLWYDTPDPPSYKKLLKQVQRAAALADQLAQVMEASWPLEYWPEAFPLMLQEFREHASRKARAIDAAPGHRGQHSRLKHWVWDIVNCWKAGTGKPASVTWDTYHSQFSGKTLDFVVEVASRCGIPGAPRTFAKHIKGSPKE